MGQSPHLRVRVGPSGPVRSARGRADPGAADARRV